MYVRICDYCGERKNLKSIKLTHRPNDEDIEAELCEQCIEDIRKEETFEDVILKEMAESMRDIVIVEGCRTCMHQIINCRNHTHCSSLGHELICNCEVCGGTGKPKEE